MSTRDETVPVGCRLQIGGMDCGDCAKTVERSLATVTGVRTATVNFMRGTADVTYDPLTVEPEVLVRRVSALGYTASLPVVATPTRDLLHITLPLTEATADSCKCGTCGYDEYAPHKGDTTVTTLDASAPTRTTWVFDVTGMDCGDCAKTVQAGVARLSGVRAATVNFAVGTLVVAPDTAILTPDQVLAAVRQAGYAATVRSPSPVTAAPVRTPQWWQSRRVRELAGATLLWFLGFALERLGQPRFVSAVPFLTGMALAGYPISRAGWFALKVRRADMNLLMVVAAAGAVAIGQWDEGASVLILFGIGTTLQALTVERTRRTISGLTALAPAEATVVTGNEETRVPVASVRVGDTVRVRPGERLPVDGTVLAGASLVNQAPITGESIPVTAEPGTGVYAGSINGDGTLEVRSSKPAADTTLARIITMVEEAQASRAPSQAFVDRFAAIYTPVVIVLAALVAVVPPLLTGAWHEWLVRALILLVIACPCALVISTPVALVAAIGAAGRAGVLFKGGAALEALASVRTIAFDKTGTLTEGRPVVAAIHACDGHTDGDVLTLAASLEAQSEHVLARAITNEARDRGLLLPAVTSYTAIPGRGGRGIVDNAPASVGSIGWFRMRGLWTDSGHADLAVSTDATVCVERNGQLIGILTLRDALRPTAPRVVGTLRSLVGHVVMLTGDNAVTAGVIAAAAGVSDVRADLLPADKTEAIRTLAKAGPVAMIGDGINDAPALATATVGIAMGVAGTDAAIEAADIALMGDDLRKLPYAVRLARGTLAIIRQNIGFSLVTKAIFLILTFAGVTNLWLAVLADMGTSLLVTANALRVLRVRDDEPGGKNESIPPA